jgi:hypothetical protein
MRKALLILFPAIALLPGCDKDDDSGSAGKFIDYGYISTVSLPGTAQMIYHKGEIFVGSDDGIWKIKLTEKVWRRAGLAGKKVISLYSHPAIEGKFFAGTESTGPADKSFHVSINAGLDWQAAVSPVFDTGNDRYEPYTDIRARPGHPDHLFANLRGTTIAVSKDGGLTWNRQNYATDSYFGIDCVINFLENNPNEIFQGAEAPLDHAWLGKYSINAADPVNLGQIQKLIGDSYEWENKRPNSLETFPVNPGVFYTGMEGALAKVEGTQWTYLFKGEQAPDYFPYTYVKGIWVNPSDKRHIIFGGGVNGTNTTLSLYQTFDEGQNIEQVSDKLGMTDPEIIDIVATDHYPAILIRDNGDNKRMRLVLFKY